MEIIGTNRVPPKKEKTSGGFSDPVVSDHIFAGNPGPVGYMAGEHSSK